MDLLDPDDGNASELTQSADNTRSSEERSSTSLEGVAGIITVDSTVESESGKRGFEWGQSNPLHWQMNPDK